jgi:hypothetical protein
MNEGFVLTAEIPDKLLSTIEIWKRTGSSERKEMIKSRGTDQSTVTLTLVQNKECVNIKVEPQGASGLG